jgi:hypothetical protein
MHLGNAFVRYLCVIIFKLFLVIQIMRIFLKIITLLNCLIFKNLKIENLNATINIKE